MLSIEDRLIWKYRYQLSLLSLLYAVHFVSPALLLVLDVFLSFLYEILLFEKLFDFFWKHFIDLFES